MAALSMGIPCGRSIGRTRRSTSSFPSTPRISCIGWDPEGILGPPQTGHIARREFQRRLEKDVDAREAFARQVREEQERRRALRQSRVVPDTCAGLIEYFLDTEAQELEYEISRLRPRLNEEFFTHLQNELGQLRFSVSRTEDMEDRLIELEAMQKVLLEGTEAYDKLQNDLILAKQRLAKILQSKDKKATLLDMVERNELDRSLLALLDENIANAHKNDQKQAVEFMEKIRAAVLKYMTQSLSLMMCGVCCAVFDCSEKAESNKQRRNPRNQDIMFVGLLPSLTSHRCNRLRSSGVFAEESIAHASKEKSNATHRIERIPNP
ncbi:hypothetical protein MRB53_003079 [Persea americana]|uniref:Uncharacterized protein n=1 Tax=Persea americana TaxID=3435 RepID=A0ACC2MWJ4_PERAE|nr:hypothetical protein MRB53_003079 [Persea americana]